MVNSRHLKMELIQRVPSSTYVRPFAEKKAKDGKRRNPPNPSKKFDSLHN